MKKSPAFACVYSTVFGSASLFLSFGKLDKSSFTMLLFTLKKIKLNSTAKIFVKKLLNFIRLMEVYVYFAKFYLDL
jgi:hypothetical protein